VKLFPRISQAQKVIEQAAADQQRIQREKTREAEHARRKRS
jgi:hypothetical protein